MIQDLRASAPALRASGQQAVLTIATDGRPTDGDLAAAMRPLAELPVWVVVRLCTDDDDVVEYWNNIDDELELDLDVLDDLAGEAAEVTEFNPWIVYPEALHRLREFGIQDKLFDLLDERALSPAETAEFIGKVLGGDELPHPGVDFKAFKAAVESQVKQLAMVWDPLEMRRAPWVKVRKLGRLDPNSCQCTIC